MRLRCISAGRFADATNNGNLVFVEVGEVWERVPAHRDGREESQARVL